MGLGFTGAVVGGFVRAKRANSRPMQIGGDGRPVRADGRVDQFWPKWDRDSGRMVA
jgi:hypothetical protein